MIRLNPEQFWRLYRDEVRRRGSLKSLWPSRDWTAVAVGAAKAVCANAGLKTGNELYLDVMGYEQRESGVDFNWDLRVAFEHENTQNWHDELCKLCHVVADLRVLAGYFRMNRLIEERLQTEIEKMGERMTRVPDSQWLFIFGPDKSEDDERPWVAYTLNSGRRLIRLADDNPFNPHAEFSRRV